jgi:hypothetical protein
MSADIGRSERHSKMSGAIPISRSSRTLCWVGFVFNSPAAAMNGKVAYAETVSEVTSEPNYDAALSALKSQL